MLDVDKKSQLTHWLYFGKNGESKPAEYTVGRGKLPPVGSYRTFVYSDEAQPAIIAVSSLSLEVRLNGALKFSHNSFWSADQQVNVELQPGLNVIDIKFLKGRRTPKTMPAVYLYDPVGLALSEAQYPSDSKRLQSAAAEHDQLLAERGSVINLQAAAGLQFAPKELRVTPGSKVRLVFENPDIMLHNWVLIKPGSFEEVGKLADDLASTPEGVKKDYLPTSDKILHHSKLLAPKETQEIVFNAPTEPGEYPYICTFPGHWRLMKGVLVVAERKAAVVAEKPVMKPIGDGVIFETTSAANGFKTIVPPSKPSGKIVANQKTNNDPISSLTDGKLAEGFGPIFANGITDGAYKLDLGKPANIAAINAWSYAEGGKRGGQQIAIYASSLPKDPGWEVGDQSKFTPLGTISTKGQKLKDFTALSLRSKNKTPLGKFRWIVWQVSPVTKSDENTAFQELAVELSD